MLVGLLAASACGGSPTEPTTDWIELDSISPAAGATLTAGERVTFTAVVTCTIVGDDGGLVSMVLQDHRQVSLKGADQPSPVQSLRKGTTTVTLSDTVTVPAGASMVVVWLPMFVDGITTTRLMKRLEYPVR
jgi:hypothetical protein